MTSELFSLGVYTTSLLFFFRVRAVFWGHHRATGFFLLLWFAILGTCASVPFSVESKRIGSSGPCIITEMRPYCSSCMVTLTTYDTVIFFAISWRLLAFFAPDESLRKKLKYFIGRRALPLISETLLRSGQKYYLYEFNFYRVLTS